MFNRLLILIAPALFLLNCSENPVIQFPDTYSRSIEGFINPKDAEAEIILYRFGDPVDTTEPDPNTGHYIFKNISIGEFTVVITPDNYYPDSSKLTIYDDEGNYSNKSNFNLEGPIHPYPVKKIEPDRDTIHYRSWDNYTTIKIRFEEDVDVNSIKQALSITPDIPYTANGNSSREYSSSGYIKIPNVFFFNHPEIEISISESLKTETGKSLEKQFSFTYYNDTASIDIQEINHDCFIEDYDILRLDDSSDEVYYDIEITFDKKTELSRIRNSLSITPEASYDLLWDPDTLGLIIRFLNPLMYKTDYTATFDKTLFPDTGVFYQSSDLKFEFSTYRYSGLSFTPEKYDNNVSLTTPFSCKSRRPVDTSSFIEAFSITPSVDSLEFRFSNLRKEVSIHHQRLQPNTSYAVYIDSSLKLSNNYSLGSVFKYTFTTCDSGNTVLSLVKSPEPRDTVFQAKNHEAIELVFLKAVDKSVFEEKLSISPDIPYNLNWPSDSKAVIEPLQPYMSDTIYNINIDSGYTSKYGIKAVEPLNFMYKSEPLMLESYSPLNNEINVSPTKPVELCFNNLIDTAGFIQRISFVPEVDSLKISVNDSSNYIIEHHPFDPGTDYQLIIPESITDIYGKNIKTDYTIRFYTSD